jgi:hypothetical protein
VVACISGFAYELRTFIADHRIDDALRQAGIGGDFLVGIEDAKGFFHLCQTHRPCAAIARAALLESKPNDFSVGNANGAG